MQRYLVVGLVGLGLPLTLTIRDSRISTMALLQNVKFSQYITGDTRMMESFRITI